MTSNKSTFKVLWLQSGGCGGCSMSLLCAEAPGLISWLEHFDIEFIWHPSLSAGHVEDLPELRHKILKGELQIDALCLEGSVLRGPNGTGRFHHFHAEQSMADFIHEMAQFAQYTVAVGSCAAYGGITMAGGNPSEACGLQYEAEQSGGLLGRGYRSRAGWPVINIAGCPTHPDWVRDTLLGLALQQLSEDDMDQLVRPRLFADHLVHHGCPRNEFYEFKASAEKPAQLGCLMENLGCVGTQAHADCNSRLWNGNGSCIRGGYACINCTAPGFEEPGHSFLTTPKVAGIPIGLPTDMPKAGLSRWLPCPSRLPRNGSRPMPVNNIRPSRRRSDRHASEQDHVATYCWPI